MTTKAERKLLDTAREIRRALLPLGFEAGGCVTGQHRMLKRWKDDTFVIKVNADTDGKMRIEGLVLLCGVYTKDFVLEHDTNETAEQIATKIDTEFFK